jgi:hypothetical protein
MATGDVPDLVYRLRTLLPPWFPNQGQAPVLDAILTGIATLLSTSYGFIQYARAQSRISTASGGWLDLIAWDFFGSRFQRRPTETDLSFQPRLKKELIRPRLTRPAIISMVRDLTGFTPSLIEPFNGQDLGGFDLGNLALDAAGGMGATNHNNQIWVTAFRPITYGLQIAAGFDAGPGGFDTGLLELLDPQVLPSVVADAEITARIQQTVAQGIFANIGIISPPPAIAWDVPGVDWDQPGTTWP